MPGMKVRVQAIMFALLLMMFTLAAVAVDFGEKRSNDKRPGQNQDRNKKNSKTPSDETSAQLAEKIYTAVPSQYVGTDTCKTCHEDIGKTFDKGPHWKTLNDKHGVQWQGCEACHLTGQGARRVSRSGEDHTFCRPLKAGSFQALSDVP